MTHTEALQMARDALANVTEILDMALMIGLPTLPPGADGPAVKARAVIAAIDDLQSTHPADASKSGAQIDMAPASLHAAALAMVAAMDQLDAGTDGPWWEDWCNGNGDPCDLIGPAIAGLRAAVSGFSAPAETAEAERARWESAIGAEMPADFKDWRGNSPTERPAIAAWVIRNLRQRLGEAEMAQPSAPADKADPATDWPIARLTINDDDQVTATMYAPGLPPGQHDVWCIPVAQHSAPSGEPAADLRERLTDAIAAGLHGTYHCTRVWSAWQVGTMDENDFEPVDESDTPGELADAVLALIGTAPAAQAPQAATASVEGLANHVPAGTEAEAATNAKLGMVLLPPIRVDRATHAALQQAAKARGVILPAIVRERLAPYTIPTELLAQIPQRRGEIMGGGPQVMTQAEGALASRVAELCDEVRELKRLLAPSNAVILTGALTGAEVVEHFRRLQPTHDGDGYTMRVE